jgi:acyl-CoA synthetase (AMP-forming)/AMP-acid ligase II
MSIQNVSAAEVGGVISGVENIADCCVYGVEVPGADGKAGMAALQPEFDPSDESKLNKLWEKLHSELNSNLPSYARPLFYR